MNYAEAATQIAAKGRNGDTMLVHMNPIEVKWMDSMTPGGLTVNPDTGQPEAFAFLLPLLANFAAPSLMASLGLTGMGATLGSAALSGLADYAVNRDPNRALGSAMLGFGLGSLGNAMSRGANAVDAVRVANTSQIGDAARTMATTAARPAGAAISDAARTIAPNAPQAALPTIARTPAIPQSGLQAIMSDPGGAFRVAMADPTTIAAPIAMGLSSAMSPTMPAMPVQQRDPRYQGDYQRERLPGARERRRMTDEEFANYGLRGGEFAFFTPNNDRRASPPSLGAPGLGAYRGYAQGGKIEGPGDGMHDAIPIMASDGEYMIPADVVSALGRGSTNGGASVLDRFVEQVRSNPPRERAA